MTWRAAPSVVGLVNNTPHAAMAGTEQRFRALLTSRRCATIRWTR